MTSIAGAAACSRRVTFQRVRLVENFAVARDTYLARVDCPSIARAIVPGQFVMLRGTDSDDPLLGRALALYDTQCSAEGVPWAIDLVYAVVGSFTRRLSKWLPGQELDIWGPLGNGFTTAACDHLVLVAGGIGHTPFLALLRERLGQKRYGGQSREVRPPRRITLCYGARSREYLASLGEFLAMGIEVLIATDDGSHGHHGLVTDLMRHVLDHGGYGGPESTAPQSARVLCCGPERMMEAAARLAAGAGVVCDVSLETPMACGIGICFSCVTRVIQEDGGWDYRRTCVEGPIFDAARIIW